MQYDHMRFILGMKDDFSISEKSVKVIYHTKKKGKSHTIISWDTEKAFVKIQHPFMMKILNKVVT